MRKHLMQDFTRVYHLHLEGNVRQNPKLSGTAYNVFGIQVGVGITIAVKSSKHKDRKLLFHRIDKNLRRAAKCELLNKWKSMAEVKWETLKPDTRHTWLLPEHADEFDAFLPVASQVNKAAQKANVQSIFKLFSVGVKTNRDEIVYDFDRSSLADRVKQFTEDYNAEVDRYKRSDRKVSLDEFVRYDKIKWSESLKATLAGIPKEVFDYRLGNRSALDWVIDQYQVSEDKRSGIKSDPNRPDDPEYIVRLIGQVVKVSLETVRIVSMLPTEFA
jgi:predicted helicase